MGIIEVFEGPIVPFGPKKGSGNTDHEEHSHAVARRITEASGAATAAFSRWTLADLVRKVDEATGRWRQNMVYFI